MKTIKLANRSLDLLGLVAQEKMQQGHRAAGSVYVDWRNRFALKIEAEPNVEFKRLMDRAAELGGKRCMIEQKISPGAREEAERLLAR